jgi:hypothetical protein
MWEKRTYDQWLYRLKTLKVSSFVKSNSSSPFFLYSINAIPGKLVDKKLSGKIGVLDIGVEGREPVEDA